MDPILDTVARAAEGDRQALDVVFERNLGPLVAFIRMKAGGVVAARESALDIAQSVCREVLQDFDQFEFRGETAFRNWLFLHATRKILDRNRYHHRDRRDAAREVNQHVGSGDETETLLASYGTLCTPTRQVSAREELARIESAILELPEDQREAVMTPRMTTGPADFERTYGETHTALGRLLRASDHPAEGRQQLVQALFRHRKATLGDGVRPSHSIGMRDAYVELIEAQIADGEALKAAILARALAEALPGDAHALYASARALGRTAITDKTELIGLLQRSARIGYEPKPAPQQDPAFARLHSDPEFQAVAATFR